MRAYLFLILVFLFLQSCKTSNDKLESQNSNKDTTLVKNTAFIVDTLSYRNLLQGIWAKDESSNADFEIKGDSLFYFEDPIPVYYDVKEDSFRVLIDDRWYSSRVIKLSKDSFNRVERGEVIKLYKIKQ